MRIDPPIRVTPPTHVEGASPLTRAEPSAGATFAQTLERVALAVVEPHAKAAEATQSFVRDQGSGIHDTLMTVDKADISLKFMVSVRNRLLEAYREIMQMGM